MHAPFSIQSLAPVALGAVCALALSAPAAAQDDKTDKKAGQKIEQAQWAEAQALVRLVDDAAGGKPAASTLPFKWESQHFVKAQAEKTYVPFTLAFDPGALSAPSVGVYLRVMARGAAPEAPPAPDADKDKKKGAKAAEPRSNYPFEDLFFIDAPAASAPDQPVRLRRAFAVPPGEYDVYIAVKERASGTPGATGSAPTGTAGPAPVSFKVGVIKQPLSVPDLGTELTTSTVILAERVEVLQAPLPSERQSDNPYTFGQMKITPAVDGRFTKKGELSVIFWIYGAGTDVATKKPDVNIDFKFYKKDGDKETYFNKTDPQALNAQTLPPQFDMAAGHLLLGSMVVPLASFPEGDYRLDIELTDKVSGKSLKRDAGFTVVP